MANSDNSTIQHHIKFRNVSLLWMQKGNDKRVGSEMHQAAESLRKEINNISQEEPACLTEDRSILTNKGSASMNELCFYVMRDTIQWWLHWNGSLDSHYWKHLYVAFCTTPEDLFIHPKQLLNGEFRVLGNSLSDVLDGLHKEKVNPERVAFMEMSLLRQYLFQAMSKQEPQFDPKLCNKTDFAVAWRHITANTYGVTMAILAAKESDPSGIVDIAARMTPMADAISMQLINESNSTPDIEAPRDNQQCVMSELLEVYSRYMALLGLQPSAPLLSRSVSSGTHFVPTMDAFRERIKNVHFPTSASLRLRINSYIK